MCRAYVRLDAWHVMEATFGAVIKWTAVCTCDASLRCAAKVVGDCVARRMQRAVRFGRNSRTLLIQQFRVVTETA